MAVHGTVQQARSQHRQQVTVNDTTVNITVKRRQSRVLYSDCTRTRDKVTSTVKTIPAFLRLTQGPRRVNQIVSLSIILASIGSVDVLLFVMGV